MLRNEEKYCYSILHHSVIFRAPLKRKKNKEMIPLLFKNKKAKPYRAV